ncbi:MAG TPA: hypothetical protein PLI90_11090, partial [Rhodocyclaceae bacterium]|nr:hypothetical protein [Rhodocyclaceae bacterium]
CCGAWDADQAQCRCAAEETEREQGVSSDVPYRSARSRRKAADGRLASADFCQPLRHFGQSLGAGLSG